MQVQRIQPNNCYYNRTFCARQKPNNIIFADLEKDIRKMIGGIIAKDFDPNEFSKLVLEFSVKFIKSPQERSGLRPIGSYLKEYFSNREIGLRQKFNILFRALKNVRKLKKETHSMSFQQKMEQKIKPLKNKFEQPELEKGVIELAKFLDIKHKLQ